MIETIPRTKTEALLDVRYQIRLAFLHQRFYRRVRALLAFVALCASSAAVMTVLQPWPNALRLISLVVAFVGFADIIGGFAEKAAQHGVWRQRFAAVLTRADALTLEEIDRAIAEHEGHVDDEIESLRLVALNDNCRSNGHEDWVRPEPTGARLMRVLA